MKKTPGENRLGNSFTAVIDIIYIGILWLLCCLPIVTIGPAGTAMYYAVVKSVRHGRGHCSAAFFGAFKSNFKSGLKTWLVFLLLILLWAGNAYFTGITDPEGARLMTLVSRLLIVPVLVPLLWLFPYVSRFDNSFGDTMKYVVYISVRNILSTIKLLLIFILFLLAGWLFPVLIPLLPGFCCLLMSFQTEPVFKRITAEFENDGNQDKWYNE